MDQRQPAPVFRSGQQNDFTTTTTTRTFRPTISPSSPHHSYEKIAEVLPSTTLDGTGYGLYGRGLTPNQKTYQKIITFKLTQGQLEMLFHDESLMLQLCIRQIHRSSVSADSILTWLDINVNGKMLHTSRFSSVMTPSQLIGKPCNITSSYKLENVVYINWASRSKANDFLEMSVTLVREVRWRKMLAQLLTRKPIPSSTTRRAISRKIAAKLDDDEIISDDPLSASLVCPIGKTRMKNPCKFIGCNHLQCFDATAFLQMHDQSRKKAWICPVCDQRSAFDSLAVDEYFQLVLDNAAPHVTEISLDIAWTPVNGSSSGLASSSSSSSTRSKRTIEEVTLDDSWDQLSPKTPKKRVCVRESSQAKGDRNPKAAADPNSTARPDDETSASTQQPSVRRIKRAVRRSDAATSTNITRNTDGSSSQNSAQR